VLLSVSSKLEIKRSKCLSEKVVGSVFCSWTECSQWTVG
jgi:hypothetical protein